MLKSKFQAREFIPQVNDQLVVDYWPNQLSCQAKQILKSYPHFSPFPIINFGALSIPSRKNYSFLLLLHKICANGLFYYPLFREIFRIFLFKLKFKFYSCHEIKQNYKKNSFRFSVLKWVPVCQNKSIIRIFDCSVDKSWGEIYAYFKKWCGRVSDSII